MNANPAPAETTEATTCYFCGKPIVDGHWFARLHQDSRRLVFCRPHCVERFLEQQEAADENWPLPRTLPD